MKVLVIGDFIIDRYIYGHMKKRPNIPEENIFIKEKVEEKYGGAGNTAYNCYFHRDTTLLTSVVNLKETPYHVVNFKGKTVDSIVERFVVGGNTTFRADTKKLCEKINLSGFETNSYNVILLSDYARGVLHDPREIIKNSKCPVIVDPKGINWDKYTGAFCITPNRNEFEEVCGEIEISNIRNAIRRYQLKAMIITLDKDGVWMVTDNHDIRLEASQCQAVDVTGAGDTFIAIFACYFDNLNLERSLRIANYAAGISISKFGTYAVTKEDLIPMLEDGVGKTLTVITPKISEESKPTVVFTCGVFDIVHANHIYMLVEASKLGDKLIVGLNSDACATRIKRRPINTEEQRKLLLEQLPFVDEVILFDESVPLNLVKRLKPDIFVKGGDYKKEDIPERHLVKRLVLIQGINKQSTTKIIDTIEKRFREQ